MKKYTGSVYIGVVGGDVIPTKSMLSILNITRQEDDAIPSFRMSTKGYVGRQQHIDAWMESEHEFILLLDHDMVFAEDTLERLRSHQLPFVSGYYMRRRHAPIAPVWFKPFTGKWPFHPWTAIPERNKLHELGASGWGCILIHRDVIVETRKILKGEQEVIEDDMDVWPYDLAAVIQGEEQLKPLRGCKDIVGSDIRYPFYAKAAGFTLWGDPDVRPSHVLDYPLSPDDYEVITPQQLEWLDKEVLKDVNTHRTKIYDELKRILGGTS